ncbi:MAG: tetratricopeptide repeat protein [candidate division Zixibacteria bacterium]|nr:tetratricopeptide repeat protein [candidate division Zixibacteria bacterium]
MKMDFSEIDERIAKCQKILDADPNSQIFAALADAYRKKGLFAKAYEICSKGIEKHPDYGSAYIVMAKISLDQGNHAEAAYQLQRAVAVGGRTRSVDVLEAEILMMQGQINRARHILEKLHISDPKNDTVNNLILKLESLPAAGNAAVVEPVAAESAPSKAQTAQPSIKHKYSLSHALSIIKILPRVLGVVAVAKNGMVVEGHFDGIITREELGALATAAYDEARQAVSRINFGQPREILIEAEQSKLLIFDRDRVLIVIATRDDINLGSLKLKINEIFKQTEF